MSKRFTDTNKFKNPWYRKMPSAYRDLWEYILCECDHAGVWRIDFELASMVIGSSLDSKIALEIFENRIVVIDHDKWFIPSFVEFQYGELKGESPPHKSVIRTLIKHSIDPFTLTLSKGLPNPIGDILKSTKRGSNTPQEKEEDKDKDKDFERGVGKTLDPATASVTDQIATAWQAWADTLDLAGIKDKHMSPTDETTLASAIKRIGFARTVNALIGKRYEVKQNGYDPKSTLSIGYCVGLSGKNAAATPERLENLALAEDAKLSQVEANKKADHNARYGSGLQQ